MRHYLIAAHSYLPEGFEGALDMIAGKQEHVNVYCAYVTGEHFIDLMKEKIESIGTEDDIIIMTDLYGGSVNNECIDFLEYENVHLVSGINLLLILELILSNPNEKIARTIRRCVEAAKRGIIYCNEDPFELEPLDDF